MDETVIRLETRLREFEDRTAKKIKDLEDLVEYLTNKVEINHSSSFSLLNGQTPPLTIANNCQLQLTNLHGSSKEESEGTHGKVARLEETVAGFDERMLVTRSLMEQIQEKLYTFDVNKMNNLIFNGVPRLQNENSDRLMACVKNTIKRKLKIIRFIDILVRIIEMNFTHSTTTNNEIFVECQQGGDRSQCPEVSTNCGDIQTL